MRVGPHSIVLADVSRRAHGLRSARGRGRLRAGLLVVGVTVAAALPWGASGAQGVGGGAAGRGAPQAVTITATDYAFALPAEVPAGLTTFRLVNRGQILHHAQIVRLEGGKRAGDFVQSYVASFGPAAAAHESRPAWARALGGPAATDPGQAQEVTVALPPGDYALVCDVVLPDGVPHLKKGMVRAFRVVPATGAPAAEPRADVTLTIRDYGFELSAPLRSGRQTVRVDNAGREAHTAVLVRLAPGKTAEDLRQWARTTAGPPPIAGNDGGMEHIDGGRHAFFTAVLTPGEYALVCFAPGRDGKPQLLEHDMVRQVSVR